MLKLALVLIFVTGCGAYPSPQPVIGILTETVLDSYRSCYGQYKVLSDYQSFVEQGGGGAVPIFVNQTDDYYEKLIPRLNGILLTGGGANLITSPYAKAAFKIFNMAKAMNDEGKHFPIWGTCLGMEEMSTWPFNPRVNPLKSCSQTENVCLPLNFTSEAKDSKLYGSMPAYIHSILAKERVTPNFHNYCLTMKTYSSFKELSDFYSVLSTNFDGNGQEFVSTIEARDYPFFGVQFHPEKINFLHSPHLVLTTTLNATLVAQYFGNFLVEQAKMSTNRFNSLSEESRFLFNSYQTMFTDFYEYYCFKDSDVPKFDN